MRRATLNTRRRQLTAAGLTVISLVLPAFAQERPVRRIGFFSQGSAQAFGALLAAFREGMAELRWIEGRDYTIDARFADGTAQAGPALADDLVATRPDLLLTPADEGVRLLLQRTSTIPIVFAIVQDPVANRLVASLKRPGASATGLTTLSRDLGAKRLQLLKEAFPRVAHVGRLNEPAQVRSPSQANVIEAAAARLRMRVARIDLRQASDIEPAFKRGAAIRVQADMVAQGPLMSAQGPAVREHIRSSGSRSFSETAAAWRRGD